MTTDEHGETTQWRAFGVRERIDVHKPTKLMSIGEPITIERTLEFPDIPEYMLGNWKVEKLNEDGSYTCMRYVL